MDHVLYWLDGSDWFAPLAHVWIWVSLTAALAIATIVGIAALARHYDGNDRHIEHRQVQA
jgi:hypothetical protein